MKHSKKVLVTGGAGYIGAHTVVDLFKNKYTPIIVDNLCNSSAENINGINKILNSNIKWYNKDCSNFEHMQEVFDNEKNITGCIHFAAFKSVKESIENPKKYFDNNVGSLKVLLKCMEMYEVSNIIFSSSCTVYGIPELLPVTEDAHLKKTESPYAETKKVCEFLLEKNKIASISLRYFNPIGCHSSLLIGDYSSERNSNLLPIISEVASGKRDKIIVFGNDYSTIDGTCVRDYIHVEDLANAHVKAMGYILDNNIKSSVFNVGNGHGLSVLEIINSFIINNKVKINYEFGDRRIGDIDAIFSNCTKIKNELKWKPIKTLNQAMIDVWNWEKNKKSI